MITNYKQAKEDVLKIYADFLPLLNKIKQGKTTTFESSIEALASQAEDIKHDKFLLMIVGEAKSGKSTFINAYLGEEILPMDVKQCTSSIVEIRYGERFILKATFADDRIQLIEDEQEIKEFLRANAALDDTFRDIPVPTININILMAYKGKTPPETVIRDLLKGIESENIHRLPTAVYEAKVRQYISEKQPHWRDIVKKIEIEYPFEDVDMKGIEIVDTPGVNAEGRVGEITNDYIAKANAVMFLKPIAGTALEASSFKKFLGTASADRNKNAMFLILTRTAPELRENVIRQHEEALRQFPEINPQQIICVDSKVELFYNRIRGMSVEDLGKYMDSLIEAEKIEPFLDSPWFKSRFNKDTYLKKLKEISNFAVVDHALNLFAHKAQYIALSEFLQRLLNVLGKMQAKLIEEKGYYEEKAVNPEELAIKLSETKARLDSLTLALYETVDIIGDRYSDPKDGVIEQRAKAVVEAYKREIASINPNDSSSVDSLEKISFQKIDAFKEFQDELLKNILAECDAALISLSDKSGIKFPETMKPDVTKQAIEAERVKTEKEERERKEEYTTGLTFKKTHERSAFSQSRYYSTVKSHIDGKIDTIRNNAVRDLRRFVIDTISVYREELSQNVRIKKAELTDIIREKETAEQIQEKLQQMAGWLEQIIPMCSHIAALKGGIDRNV